MPQQRKFKDNLEMTDNDPITDAAFQMKNKRNKQEHKTFSLNKFYTNNVFPNECIIVTQTPEPSSTSLTNVNTRVPG